MSESTKVLIISLHSSMQYFKSISATGMVDTIKKRIEEVLESEKA